MVTSRGAFFLGLSLIICVAMLIYGPQIGKFRYLTMPTNQGLFILDTKTQMMNVCTDKNCRIVPHEVSGGQVPGMQPTYGQMQMAPVNSLGVIESSSMPGGFSCGNGVCVMPMQMQQQPPQTIQVQPAVQPKPVAPTVMEERSAVVPEMAEPEPVMRQVPPAAQRSPMARPVAPQPQVMMPPRPQAVPIIPARNPAEAQVLADERSLQTTEQALGLGLVGR